MTDRTALARAALLSFGVWTCAGTPTPDDYEVVRTLPHDTGAYTQGLVYDAGRLYESTGEYGRSDVRVTDPVTGQILQLTRLADDRFGEGLALLDGTLYQLTWKSGVAYVYDAATLTLTDSLMYEGEGWGLATDGTNLIMSNGTSTLKIVDPEDFSVVREIAVTDDGAALTQINELEYIDGKLYANVYQSDWIVRIDAATGAVE
ncbi:MAG: glutaminyl-peptide cyclotransferase, partial [Acidimicrobiia bacterium]|nr:glutaminyl-peptide cyclotransferase [Acidimicrobiia bacterium]